MIARVSQVVYRYACAKGHPTKISYDRSTTVGVAENVGALRYDKTRPVYGRYRHLGVALCQLRICVYIYMDLFRWTRRMVNLQNCGHCDQTIQV